MTIRDWLGEENQIGIDIWNKKYRFEDETFEEWLDRISCKNDKMRNLIKEKKFLFGGRILSNRGTGKKATMMNCYSRGFVEDSLDDIMKANTDIAKTFQAQGGQGLSLSKIRPKDTGINNNQFKSDGIIPFMEIFNRTTESISQGGSRKGALLMSLDIWHKEAENFIKIKSEAGKIEKTNLSLEIDDDFMSYVADYYDTGEEKKLTIEREYNGHIIKYEVTPIKLYKLMIEKAWESGEPGCLFVNQFRNYNLMEYDDEYCIETCNPCGEQPLPKHGACNLGSLNLSEFVENPFTDKAVFNMESFLEAVGIAVEALDEIVDENLDNHALKEQRETSFNYRNIGLGVFGLYECLTKLQLKYGNHKSLLFIDDLMYKMFRQAVSKSNLLAKEKGTFPKYNSKIWKSKIIKNHFNDPEIQELKKYGLRNCALLSIAPTGSIGSMLNMSTGCEPAYALSYQRKTESLNSQTKYYDVNIDVVNQFHKLYPNQELPDYFTSAKLIDWRERINIQSTLQYHIDTAISSTINLKEDISLDEVETLYLYAWQKALKGITIYREGGTRKGILTEKSSEITQSSENKTIILKRGEIIPCSDNLIGLKRTLMSGCGSLHCNALFDSYNGQLREIFLSKGSTGGCNQFMIGLSRMISIAARGGVAIDTIIDQLMSTGVCPSYNRRTREKHDTSKGSCCPMAVGYAIKDMQEQMNKILEHSESPNFEQEIVAHKNIEEQDKCPECGEPLYNAGGCVHCHCGWSKC